MNLNIGIDLGGSHIAIGVIDSNDVIVEKVDKRIMSKEKSNIKLFLEDYIVNNVKKLMEKYEITEIGMAVPGTIKGKEIVKSVKLGVENYNLVEIIEREISLPVKIRNDAKCAAIAECRMGVLKDSRRSVFLTLGTGIGGAVIIDGKLLDTGSLPGCEFGHMIIQKNGTKCSCGNNGCFENYASMKAFKDNLRNVLGFDENVSGKELLDYIRENPQDERVENIIEEFIEYLSIGISNLINIFEPEIVGIGGSFVYFSDILLDRLKDNIQKKNYLFNYRDKLIILPACLGNDAGIIGSV